MNRAIASRFMIPQPDQNFWWMAMGMALVVIVCVIILLSLLGAFVADIEENVESVTIAVTDLAHNTNASPLLPEAARLIGELGAAVGRHVQLHDPEGNTG
jgi:hypothetical protein